MNSGTILKEPYAKSVEDVFGELETSESGLSDAEARKRLEKNGPNKLPEGKRESYLSIFLRQFESPLIYILAGAAAVVLYMGEEVDAFIILFVLLFNSIVGTVQEGRAQNTLLALKKWGESQAAVIRDRHEIIIPDSEVVVGDIIVLHEGEKVPADARVILASSLRVDEASLTGESEPVTKKPDAISGSGVPTASQENMLFKGTHVLAGSGLAVVVSTGMKTEIGKIAKEIQNIDTEIPLKANIRYLSRLIIAVTAGISVFLIIIGVSSGRSLFEMFRTAVALAVSIIPEGLPIVMTLVLATGVWRMSKRHALVKRLQAVEALGQTKIICVDKTGTLTRNEMVVERIYTGGEFFEISGNGYEPRGEVRLGDKIIDPKSSEALRMAGKVAAYCSNARVLFVEATRSWKIAGDPTEAALAVVGEKLGFNHDLLLEQAPVEFELPFDYKNKFHAVIHQSDDKNFLTVVGAPEKVLRLCREFVGNIETAFNTLAQGGFRVLAFAYHSSSEPTVTAENMPALTFGGFFAMKDALRSEAKEAVSRVQKAGIKVVMITGDHKLTAEAIAKEVGIWRQGLPDGKAGSTLLSGEEIEKMTDPELGEKIKNVSVFARVTPEHKLRIVEAYRKQGEVVAMTGDGVNDAPSLVAADLGVSMGSIGTEVAKEASDIVLLDDNFGSIVSAVEEGRSIYKTIKKVILYLFSTSLGEVLTIAGAILLGFPLPILPAQIIWLNFVTDGFLDVALAMEPNEKNILKEKFEKPKKWIVDKLMQERMFLMASIMAIGTIIIFGYYYEIDFAKALTMSMTVLAVYQWFNAWNCRSDHKSIFTTNPFTNLYLVGATTIVILLQLAALYTPYLQKILHTVPLSLNEWLVILPVAATIILAEEIRKYFSRRQKVALI